MPYQSEAQVIGDEGERWFDGQLPPRWLPQKPDRDIGVDRVVVICEEGDLNGQEFRVQVKASRHFKITDKHILLSGIKHSTIDYWFVSPLPTLVVAYDTTSRRGYYCWHNEVYSQVAHIQGTDPQQTTTIAIPEDNILDAKAWEMIKDDLRSHHQNLRHALYVERDSRSLLPTIHSLAAAARQLNSFDRQSIKPDERTEQHGMLALAEIMQHRFVVTTLSDLLSQLRPDSEGATRLAAWIDLYASSVRSVFPTFDELKDWRCAPPDFQIVFVKNLVESARPELIRMILEMIMLLAPGQFNREG